MHADSSSSFFFLLFLTRQPLPRRRPFDCSLFFLLILSIPFLYKCSHSLFTNTYYWSLMCMHPTLHTHSHTHSLPPKHMSMCV